jgi:hypothetical protein
MVPVNPRHGTEYHDLEAMKVYAWNSFRGMWEYRRPVKFLGVSELLGIIDEAEAFSTKAVPETSGEDDAC